MSGAGKVALITGASRGIGLAIAQALGQARFQLALGLRDPARGPALPNARAFAYEATDPAAGDRLVDETVAALGRLDVVVASAGILREVTLGSRNDDDLDDLMAINVKAPYRLARAALPHLEASGQGRFFVLASLSGKRVLGPNVGYQMSKHAMIALAHSVRRAGWDKGVRATAVSPGFVNTDMVAGLGIDTPPEAMTQPQDVATLVAALALLPNTASVAEILVNCRSEPAL